MRLAFNAMNSGLGNNGGSRTVLLCTEVLKKLGHQCDIIGTADNFTWFEHDPIIPYVPSNLDAVIATACTTVHSTLQMNASVKAWYVRAHEAWAMPDKQLEKLYKSGVLNLVNSRGLQQQLAAYGADSTVIYQGIDFDWWKDEDLRPKDKIRIGALYTTQPRKRWKDFEKLAEILGDDEYEYLSIGNAHPNKKFLCESWCNVDHDWLRRAYSSCHIWFAPTDSEGLHNVPMEASLCGCLVVCADEPLNGMIYDYAFPNNTAMVYNRKDIEHAAELIRNPNWDCIDRMNDCLINTIGNREDNMKKLVSYLEEQL